MRVLFCIAAVGLLLSGATSPLQAPPPDGSSSQAQSAGLNGAQPFLTLLCKFADVREEPKPVAYFDELLATEGRGLDAYWREVSYGHITLAGSRVIGWLTMQGRTADYRSDGYYGADLERLSGDCAAAAGAQAFIPAYAGINFVFNYPVSLRSSGGNACLPRDGQPRCYRMTWLWPGPGFELATVAHETGHAFGLAHSSSGGGEEYGNIWDVMSGDGACGSDPVYGTLPQHVIAFDKDILGWIPAGRKFVAPAGAITTLTLQQLAQPGPDGYLMAQIPIAGSATHFYTVEARRRVGQDASLPYDAVIIHEVDTRLPHPARLVTHGGDDGRPSTSMWTTGMAFQDVPHGIAVTVGAETETGFTVNIAVDEPPLPGPKKGGAAPSLVGEVLLSSAPGEQSGPVVAAGPGQDVYVLWSEQNSTGSGSAIQSARHVASAATRDSWQLTGAVEHAAKGALFANPKLVVAAGGDVYAAWQSHSIYQGARSIGNTDLWLAHRAANGRWEGGVKINDGAVETARDNLVLGADGSGNLYAVWGEARDGQGDFYFAFRPAGGSWGTAVRVGQAAGGTEGWLADLAVDTQGNAEVVWTQVRGAHAEIRASRRPAGGDWQPDVPVQPQSTGDQMTPRVAMDGNGNTYAIWESVQSCTGRPVLADIMFAMKPAGGAWHPGGKVAYDIGKAELGDHAIAVSQLGDVYVVWEEQVGPNFELYLARRRAGAGTQGGTEAGGWGRKVRVGSVAAAAARAAQPSIVVDSTGRAYVAWVDSQAGRTQIHVSEVQP